MYNECEKAGLVGYATRPSIIDRLKEDKAHTERKLASISKAIETLEKNPELVEVVNVFQGIY